MTIQGALLPPNQGATIMEASHIAPSRYVDPMSAFLDGPLDPDTVFAVCARQIRDVDAQIKGALVRQQTRKGQGEALRDLASTISHYQEIKEDHTRDEAKAAINEKFDAAIEQFGRDSKEGKQLLEDQAKFNETIDHKVSEGDAYVTGAEMKSLGDQVNNVLSDLNTTRELDMMDLQKTMGTRQQLFQMFSNIIAKMDQTAQSILNNR